MVSYNNYLLLKLKWISQQFINTGLNIGTFVFIGGPSDGGFSEDFWNSSKSEMLNGYSFIRWLLNVRFLL